jgi:hypothetical protein
MESRMKESLDRYITGNYGEDQLRDDEEPETTTTWNSQHTAGHAVHGQTAIYDEATGKDIAIVYDGDAHAKLIAAAPELAAELRDNILRWSSSGVTLKDVSAGCSSGLWRDGIEIRVQGAQDEGRRCVTPKVWMCN